MREAWGRTRPWTGARPVSIRNWMKDPLLYIRVLLFIYTITMYLLFSYYTRHLQYP